MTILSTRRSWLANAVAAVAALALPGPLAACRRAPEPVRDRAGDPDRDRLAAWAATLRSEGLAPPTAPLGRAAIRVGELAAGTPYEPFTLEAYLRAGGSAAAEPLTLSLTRFDCVTLVESCLAVARTAVTPGEPSWDRFAAAMERMRYRGGRRAGYASRLHYFSEWIADGAARGLVRDVGGELGGVEDGRPLRFMSAHRTSYPGLADDAVFEAVRDIERRLDARPRLLVPTPRIPEVADRIETGDVVAFATAIEGLDVSHAAFAYRDGRGVLRVLHAPLSGGVVEVTAATLPEYVGRIRQATGILVARPEWG